MPDKLSKEKHKKHKKEKKKKHKKEKKSKKHKKEKYRHKSSSSSSSSSEYEEVTLKKEHGPKDMQSEWSFLDTVLNDSNVTVKEKKVLKKHNSPERPGQHVRELNPYWKDGGCGLPPTLKNSSKTSVKYSDHSFKSTKINEANSGKSRLNFLKPGEGSHVELNKNTYQRNWKKKDNQSEEIFNTKKTAQPDKIKEDTSSSSKSYSNDDLNTLAAKLVKAEIMGDTALINKLKAQLEAAKKQKDESGSSGKIQEVVVVTDRGAKNPYEGNQKPGSSKRQKIETHQSRERVRYFADDDKYSLQNLFEKEKAGDNDDDFLVTSKLKSKNPDELDDAYLEAVASKKYQEKSEERKKKKSMKEALVKHRTLEGCRWCLDNRNQTKHLVVSTGNKCYLCLPEEESLTKGHCIIVPIQHEISTLHLDEDVWDEIKTYQKALTRMFLEQEQDVVFFENARNFKSYPHCFIQCVPLDKEIGDMAPIYFQKAISESETEWTDNKKLIDFRKKDLRRSVPKGLPFFAISFGNDGGFAHIIEDELLFRRNFSEEVLGGMLDLDPRKWRKPVKENFRTQREKSLEFLKMWKKFEFNDHSDSGSESSSSD